jgi:arylsulfatase A-like enzyme
MHQLIKNTLLSAGVSYLSAGASAAWGDETKPPNIVCIFSDEIDFSYLDCYGGDFETPNIDRLAREGMRFTQAYCSSPMCTPSRFSMLTGRYPSRCEHPWFKQTSPADEPAMIGWNSFIDENTRTLPRLLSQNGYVTGMAGKWHLGPHGVDWPKDITADMDPSDPEVQTLLKKRQENINEAIRHDAGFDYAASILWGNWDAEVVKALQHHNIPWITKGAVEFIEQQAKSDKPFFLYVAPTTIHGPPHHHSLDKDYTITPAGRDEEVSKYIPDVETLKKANEGHPDWYCHQHTGMAQLDHQVGIILRKLEELGIEDNTLVIYMPDHGIEPGKATCFEKGFRVPLIIRWPGHIEPGSITEALVQNSDLFATLARIAGIPPEEAATPDGYAFTDVLKDPSSSGQRDYVYYEAGYARGISDGKSKYIAFRPPEQIIEKYKKQAGPVNYMGKWKQAHSQIAIMHYPNYFDQDQFYNLQQDPYEQFNRFGDPTPAEQKELSALQSRLKAVVDTMPNPFDLKRIPYLESQEFNDRCEEQRAFGEDYIGWLKRDHGSITWPPKALWPSGCPR